MVNSTNFLMMYSFIMLFLIIKDYEANEISILKGFGVSLRDRPQSNYLDVIDTLPYCVANI